MKYSISRDTPSFRGELLFSPSKVLSSKVLVLRVLKDAQCSPESARLTNDVHFVDHSLIADGLHNKWGKVYKALRYIRAVMSYFGGEWVLTTSHAQMGQSAHKVVEILRRFGLSVAYEVRPDSPPIKLIGKNLSGNVVRIDTTINSKMIEVKFIYPSSVQTEVLENQSNTITTSGYIPMSIQVIQKLGVNTNWDTDKLLVAPQILDGSEHAIEPDWSFASFLYQLVALTPGSVLTINGINPDSIQPDLAVRSIFRKLGVETRANHNGVTICQTGTAQATFNHSFKHYPNLIPSVIATCVCKGIPFSIYGCEPLRKKETDRVVVLQKELRKLGAEIKAATTENGEVLTFDGQTQIKNLVEVEFDANNDQRIVLALALVAAAGIKVTVQNPEVANKTYYNFWQDIEKLGMKIERSPQI